MHSKLAPSSAHRWINCPGCVRLESEFSDTTSIYAAEGTLAHKLAELKLREYLGETVDYSQVKSNELYNADMDNYTDDYVKFVKSLDNDHLILIETKVTMESINPEIYGTADCILVKDGSMHIIDFKYGQNVLVEAKDNEQLKLYALGVLELLGTVYDEPETIGVHIFQPRMDNISSASYKPSELRYWAEGIKDAANEALSDNGDINPGDWCKFCKAKSACKKYSRNYTGFTRIDPEKLSLEEISNLLTELDGIIAYYKELKEYALKLSLTGQVIPGYKPVEGRSNREWKDIDGAFNTAKSLGLSEDELYTKTPISLSKLERKLGKKKFNEYLSEFVYKPEGKPTLVPESDKRLSVLDPKYIFRNVDFEGGK